MRMEMVDLRAEAAAEVCRLAGARTFAVDGDERAVAQVEGEAPWIAVARRNRIRRALGSRLLLVWRVGFEDDGGTLVESRLVPVAVELSHAVRGRQRRRWIDAIVRELEPLIRTQIEAALTARGATPSAFERRCIPPGRVAPPSNIPDILGRHALPAGRIAALGATMDLHHGLLSDWRQAVDSVVRSFMSTRTARERAIAGRTAAAGADAFQPGLFDRRAERTRGQLAAAAADTASAAAGRLAAFARSNAIGPRAAQLLLILAP